MQKIIVQLRQMDNHKKIQKLFVDIKDLLKEKIDHKRFMNGFSNNPN